MDPGHYLDFPNPKRIMHIMPVTETVFNALENVIAPLRSGHSLQIEGRNLLSYARRLETVYGPSRSDEAYAARRRANDLIDQSYKPSFPFRFWTLRWHTLAYNRQHPTPNSAIGPHSDFDRLYSSQLRN